MEGWIGVDLDGTLAYYDEWKGVEHIGEPIPKMMFRVKKMIADGKKVKIYTARAHTSESIPHIEQWLHKHGLGGLEITNQKDYGMIECWDDRCIQVIPNTGKRVDGNP